MKEAYDQYKMFVYDQSCPKLPVKPQPQLQQCKSLSSLHSVPIMTQTFQGHEPTSLKPSSKMAKECQSSKAIASALPPPKNPDLVHEQILPQPVRPKLDMYLPKVCNFK